MTLVGALNGHLALGGKRHSGAGALGRRALGRRGTRSQGHSDATIGSLHTKMIVVTCRIFFLRSQLLEYSLRTNCKNKHKKEI